MNDMTTTIQDLAKFEAKFRRTECAITKLAASTDESSGADEPLYRAISALKDAVRFVATDAAHSDALWTRVSHLRCTIAMAREAARANARLAREVQLSAQRDAAADVYRNEIRLMGLRR